MSASETSAPQPAAVPYLMFEGDAGAAMDLYLAAFADRVPVREVLRERFDASTPRGEEWAGKVAHGRIEVAGQPLRFFDSFVSHGFSRRFAWVGDRFGVTWQLNAA